MSFTISCRVLKVPIYKIQRIKHIRLNRDAYAKRFAIKTRIIKNK